ncbi:methyltransferase domain-containing protein [Alcaligenaceae bacterium]|nr:methyltransferase domain-containing protein [Alcaligenaceae bacterium]
MPYLRRTFTIAAVCLAALGSAACTLSGSQMADGSYTPSVGQGGKDVVWVPTPQALVDHMLDMAELTPDDRLVDLGSGDGRLAITAAKRGATARGIEFNGDMVALSRRAAIEEGVADRATFEQADIFRSDFSDATVVTLFLLTDLNVRLRPTLLAMEPGTRVVSNTFDMAEWRPDETAIVQDGCVGYCRAHKWLVPAQVAGTWVMDGKQLQLRQTFQMLRGSLRDDGTRQSISDGRMAGRKIQFSVGDDLYLGEVQDDRMHGTVNGSHRWEAVRARP